jgi:hypothetical protein
MEDSPPMTERRDDDHLTVAGSHQLRRYLTRAAKASLCASCWFALCAGFLAYGPPAMNVSSAPAHPNGVVAAIFGVVLSAGAATFLTIVLAVVAVDLRDWERSQSAEKQDGGDAHDGIEDESHV